MKIQISKFAIVLISVLIYSCSPEEVQVLPDTYPMPEASLYPEGIVYSSATEKTYVGSYFKGKIITVDLLGNVSDFVIDESLVAVVGMTIDNAKNRLLVCNSDAGISLRSGNSTIGQLAEVVAYDLTTGEKLTTIDLSGLYQGGHFLNDLITDGNGNIYVTDSFSPVIYKIDENDNPSILVSNIIFEVPQGTFGLNGIVYHPDNYLIVGKSFGGIIYKVPLGNPNNIQEITLSTPVNSLDGLFLVDNNTLALVSNYFAGPSFEEAIYEIQSTNDWSSGTVTSSFAALDGSYPTTLTMIENRLFVNYGFFTDLVDPNSAPRDNFNLQRVLF